MSGMGRYADEQQKVYNQQASNGMVSTFQQMASDKWNDPIVFNGMVNNITAERLAHGGTAGMPIEYVNQQIRQDVSKMTIDRLSMMANQDPVKAYSILENGEDWGNGQHTNIQSLIGADALPSVQAHLMAGAKQVFARDIAHNTIYGGNVVDPATLQTAIQGAPPLTGVVLKNESNGQDFDKSGNLLTSSKGAQGSMQVMPATQTNPGFGVTPAKDNSPAEIARVGRDYLGAMTARYQDPALTLAAYNAGPGQVDKWIAQYGDPRTGQISDQDFLNKIPFSETRKYVATGLSMIQQPGAKPTALPTTNELATVLPSKVEQARDVAARMFPNDPGFADTVAARTSNYGETIIAGTRAQQSAAVDTITRLMIGNKPDGSDRITSMDQLMANPTAKAAWAQATPEAQLAITNRLAKPADVPLTADGLKTYYQMRGQAVNDPNAFIKQDLSSLYGQIPEKQILDLINIQSSLGKGDVNQSNKSLNWQQTKGTVDDMLKPMGLGASAKAGSDESKTTEQFYGRLQDALEQYHDQNQMYPDTATTRKIAGSLLVQGTQGAGGWLPGWLGGASTIPAFKSPDLTKFQVPVPADQKPQLAATFRKVMGRAPSDAELTQWYTKYSLSQKGK
jgi:soluble lytic murein transglycosylase